MTYINFKIYCALCSTDGKSACTIACEQKTRPNKKRRNTFYFTQYHKTTLTYGDTHAYTFIQQNHKNDLSFERKRSKNGIQNIIYLSCNTETVIPAER